MMCASEVTLPSCRLNEIFCSKSHADHWLQDRLITLYRLLVWVIASKSCTAHCVSIFRQTPLIKMLAGPQFVT